MEKQKAGAAINFKFLKHLTIHTNVGEEKGEGEESTQTAAPSDPQRGTKRREKSERGRAERRKRNCRQIKINELFNCCMWRSFLLWSC